VELLLGPQETVS